MAGREARGGVLVLGGGFAGGYVARLLGDRGATIVSEENFMLYTPLLPEAASGTLEPRHCVVPLRVMCPQAELLLGSARTLDLEARTVEIETDEGPQTVAWRELVIALGAVPRTLPVAGLAEHGLSFKTLADAIHLRNHVLHQLEAADAALGEDERRRRLTFVFVGAGYAGVEALAELSDLVEDALRLLPAAARSAATVGARRRRAADPARDPLPARRLRRRASCGGAASRSTSARRSTRSPTAEAVLGDGTRVADAHARLDGGRRAESAFARVAAAARRQGPRRGRTSCCGFAGTSTSGRSATAPASRTRAATAPTRRRASTPSARRGGWRGTSRATRRRTATGCSARSRRSAATRGSQTCSACDCAASPAGG